MRVLVKGAGVAGLTAAYELARSGAEVLVLEKGPSVGSGASWLAGGMLAPFCERESAERDVVELGAGAARWWEEAVPGLVHFKGTLVVAAPRDAGEIRRFAARTENHALLTEGEIATLEPDLAGRFRSGLFFAAEAHLDPRKALRALYERLLKQGARFLFQRQDPPPGQPFNWTIDCTGMAASKRVPALRGVRGEMLYLETREVSLSRPVRLIHPRFPLYIVPRGEGRFMVGATMIESADEGPVTARSLMELLNAAYAVHPAFGEARVIEAGIGIRPAFADNLPKLIVEDRTLFINGFHRHGFLMAPALARQAADLISTGQSREARSHEADRQRTDA